MDVLRGARSCRQHAREVQARLACPPSHSPCEGSRPQLAHRDAIRAGRGAARGEKRKPRHSHMLTSRREFIMIPAAPLDSGAPGWALSSVPVSPAKLPGRAASWSAEGEGACWRRCFEQREPHVAVGEGKHKETPRGDPHSTRCQRHQAAQTCRAPSARIPARSALPATIRAVNVA